MTLEFREVEIREVNDEKREITGLAVPYGQVTEIGTYKEMFERGAFDDDTEATLFYGHDHRAGGLPIGKLISSRNTDEGFEVTARISQTPKGDEVYALLRDGVLKSFSVGFEPVKHQTKDGVVVRTKANLKEVSIVPMPAYVGASIAEVRENNNNKEIEMTENNINSEVVELREAFSDLERKVAVLNERGNEIEVAGSQFRSYGELVAALGGAPGYEGRKGEAIKEIRAYTGGTFADNDNATRPAWIASQLKLVEEKRPVLGLFKKGQMPSSGMSIDYPVVSGVAGTVGEQVAEGDDLPYLEVTTGTASVAIKTYGGYTSLSRQEIERSEVGMLDLNLRHLVNQYAKATETAVRNALTGATGTNTGTLSADTAAGWIDLVTDSAALIEDNSKGASAEFVLVSRDVFKRLAHMVDSSGRPMFVINGDGVNSLGNVNLRGVSANVAGFPVVVGTALPANSLYVASSEALTVFEDPFKSLQDENIINLTKDFSVYGYLAVGVTNPLAIVKVDADLV